MENKPILNKISKLFKEDIVGFHTPGHQKGQANSLEFKELLGYNFLKADLTEIPGLDNLRNPLECIKDAQGLTARLFGACRTFFLVNGTTVGLHAAILALNKNKGKILIQRNAHISIINGFVLSGGQPVIASVEIDPFWGIPLGTSYNEFEKICNENDDLEGIIVTNPSYQGIGLNASSVKKLIDKYDIPLAVDEAHGAHLYFQDKIPLSYQRCNADIVVQSTHKTLGALTQSSMLHINNEKWIEMIECSLNILHTTSPSYLLLASLDDVQGNMRENGYKMLDKVWELASYVVKSLREIPLYRIFSDETSSYWFHDPSKIVISAVELGLTGWELSEILRKEYGIYVEESSYVYILILITIGSTDKDVKRLVSALKDIHKYYRKKPLVINKLSGSPYAITPELKNTPREVYFSDKEKVSFDNAINRIAGDSLVVYPPGIPLIWPGQVIKEEHIEYLKWAKKYHLPMQGSHGGKLSVIK